MNNLLAEIGISQCQVLELRELPHRKTLLTNAIAENYVIGLPLENVLSFYQKWLVNDYTIPEKICSLFETSKNVYDDITSKYPLVDGAYIPDKTYGGESQGQYALVCENLIGRIVQDCVDNKFLTVIPKSDSESLRQVYLSNMIPIRVEPYMDELAFSHFAQLARNYRIQWLPLVWRQNSLLLGPVFDSAQGPSWFDLQKRRIAAHVNEPIARALQRPPINGSMLLLSKLAICRAFHVIEQLEPGMMVETRINGETKIHEVFSWPARLDTPRHKSPKENLISSECGIIRRLRRITHHTDLPSNMVTYQADMSFTQRVVPWNCAYICEGSSFGDEKRAYDAAIGEACERYAGNMLDTLPVIHASFNELESRGIRAVKPESIVLFRESDYLKSDFPFVRFTRDLPLAWVQGLYVDNHEPVLVPASLTYSNWHSYPNGEEKPLLRCPFAGLAAGDSYNNAVMGAIEEIIERHATMTWWLTGTKLPRLKIPDFLPGYFGKLNSYQEISLTRIENIFKFPVVCATVLNHRYNTINMGFSAKNCEKDAALKALLEAFALQEGSIDLLDAEGAHWQAISSGKLPRSGLRPYRADRKYMQDFLPDFSDCTDLMAQQQYYLDPQTHDDVLSIVNTEAKLNIESEPRVRRTVDSYIDLLRRQGYRPIAIDITPADINQVGISVVRVIVPGTVMNSPAAFPHLGNDAVKENAYKLGWASVSKPITRWNRLPLPHA